MLTVLYANGEGVQRDLSLALRFACEAEGAPAEIIGRIESLKSLEQSGGISGPKFDFCDDITSGFMEGFCAARGAEIEDQERNQQLLKLSANWPEPDKSAFKALVKAQQAYSEAHARGEIDTSGTARAAQQIESEEDLRYEFVAVIKAFEKDFEPPKSERDKGNPDAEMNRIYLDALALSKQKKAEYGAVQPDGIRATQRAWLEYRNAWLTFAKIHYPSVLKDSWLALLTEDRIAILKSTFCEMGSDKYPCPDGGDPHKPGPLP